MLNARHLWRPRMVFWAGAAAIGVISVGFAMLADRAQAIFAAAIYQPGGWRPFAPLLITPLGFVVCAWSCAAFLSGSQGSGIPQAIAARHLRDDEDRTHILSLGIAAGKIALTSLGLLCGASIGREGPTVQVGASIMLQAARWGGMVHARGLILAGSAAGIAAAFNTPLAGIVFAIEEMGREYESRANGLVLMAVILAGLAALGLVGNYTYFGAARGAITLATGWPFVLACGVTGGALGAAFSWAALKAMRRIRRWNALQPLARTLVVAAACGLLVAVIGIGSQGATFGTGYSQARLAVEGTPLPFFFFLEKLLAGLLSMISGIPGGLFAPSLAVGAGIGSSLAVIFGLSTSIAAPLGMAGYFAGVVQAPMTAFVIILEMTGNHENVIPLMCVSVLGYGTARMISREPLYHALARNFVAEAIRRKRSEDDPGAIHGGRS
ncbi:MAG: chloride channel protein [Parvibaculaceae bacterium]